MKAVLVVIVILVLTSAGLIFYNSSQKKVAETPNTGVAEPLIPSSDHDESSDSPYIEYKKSILDQESSQKRVLFFYANWCPTCRPADANFKANLSKIPDDLILIRVNYNDSETDDEEKELARKYEITYQHTFVQIDGDGKVITRWNGGQIDELLANIK